MTLEIAAFCGCCLDMLITGAMTPSQKLRAGQTYTIGDPAQHRTADNAPLTPYR
jgi:hypothetical protein